MAGTAAIVLQILTMERKERSGENGSARLKGACEMWEGEGVLRDTNREIRGCEGQT